MKTSDQINEIAEALAKTQEMLKLAAKDAVNPAYRSRYADLASVWEAWRSAGPQHGLAAIQDVTNDERGMSVVTRLVHKSGQWIEFGPLTVPMAKPDAHGVGSATSYGKRYGLCAAAGIVSGDEDDDGNGAVGRPVAPGSTIGMAARVIMPTTDKEAKEAIPDPQAEDDPRARFARGELTCPVCKDRKVSAYKDNSGWYCSQHRGGCGQSWKITLKTLEEVAPQNGDIEEELKNERQRLITESTRLAQKLAMASDERRAIARRYMGEASVFDCDITALADMVKYLKTRAGE